MLYDIYYLKSVRIIAKCKKSWISERLKLGIITKEFGGKKHFFPLSHMQSNTKYFIKTAWMFLSTNNQFSIWPQLDVIQLRSVMTLPVIIIRPHRLKAQSHKITPPPHFRYYSQVPGVTCASDLPTINQHSLTLSLGSINLLERLRAQGNTLFMLTHLS